MVLVYSKYLISVIVTNLSVTMWQAEQWASLVVQMVKNPPAVPETWVQSLGWEDPLEEGMATHSSILAWRIPVERGAWWATVQGSQRVS